MSIRLSIVASSPERERQFAASIITATRGFLEIEAVPFSSSPDLGSVVLIEAALKDVDGFLSAMERNGRAVYLIIEESAQAPQAFLDGRVDDVLVAPFRTVELISKIRHFHQLQMWQEIGEINASFSDLLGKLKDDLQLAERLQKARLPNRFPSISGLNVTSRYLSGMKSGGDHFDLAESKEHGQISVILSDSSSYGLASAVLSALMRVAVKLSQDEARSSLETVSRIHEDLVHTLGEKDQLSLFYGVLSRKSLKLRYLNLGTSCAFLAPKGKPFEVLPNQGQPLSRMNGLPSIQESEISLHPSDRLVLVSDGFVEILGGQEKTGKLLERFRNQPSVDALNELVFQVKSQLESADDLPEQDCTAIVVDVDDKVLRLA